MILHAQAKHGKPGLPWLVFLHGFSGDCHEWQEVGEVFADYSRLYVDLPGHGGSAAISVDGFDDVTDLLRLARGWRGFMGLLSKAGIRGCKMLNNVRNVSVPIANGCSVFAQNR